MKKKKGLNENDRADSEQSAANNVVEENITSNDAPRAVISQRLLEQFERFYEYHPARRLSRNLRSMLLEFLMYDGSAEAEYLRDLMIDLDGLFSLLDVMEEEAERPAIGACQ
jgi:hypothetical protein